MTDFTQTRRCKAQKPRKCFFCGRTIQIGEEQVVQSGRQDGEWFTLQVHPGCDKIFQWGRSFAADDDPIQTLDELCDELGLTEAEVRERAEATC